MTPMTRRGSNPAGFAFSTYEIFHQCSTSFACAVASDKAIAASRRRVEEEFIIADSEGTTIDGKGGRSGRGREEGSDVKVAGYLIVGILSDERKFPLN